MRLISHRLKLFLCLYQFAWWLGLPFIFLYLLIRSHKDSDYRYNLEERFGFGPTFEANVWVHAVSLGEMRAVEPLLRSLLAKNKTLVVTCHTPAGRRYGLEAFSTEISKSQMCVRFAPFELFGAYRRFFKRFKPVLGLVVEQEIWPIMLGSGCINAVPIYLINSQMTNFGVKKVAWFTMLFGHCSSLATGVFTKSEASANNFKSLGAKNVLVIGELRFDQIIPTWQTNGARNFRKSAGLLARPTFVICSMTSDEEEIYIQAISEVKRKFADFGVLAPLFVLVPRALERFDVVFESLGRVELKAVKRSETFDDSLVPIKVFEWDEVDVLLGDSFGEMFFYMELAKTAIVGGGFNPSGAHNIIEPLMLGLNTLVGPHIWTIMFPTMEAQAAGLVTVVDDSVALVTEMLAAYDDNIEKSQRTNFLAVYSGATEKTLKVLAEQGHL
jgi:3-deoxy-D-manno-octulosonic-acid transferase